MVQMEIGAAEKAVAPDTTSPQNSSWLLSRTKELLCSMFPEPSEQHMLSKPEDRTPADQLHNGQSECRSHTPPPTPPRTPPPTPPPTRPPSPQPDSRRLRTHHARTRRRFVKHRVILKSKFRWNIAIYVPGRRTRRIRIPAPAIIPKNTVFVVTSRSLIDENYMYSVRILHRPEATVRIISINPEKKLDITIPPVTHMSVEKAVNMAMASTPPTFLHAINPERTEKDSHQSTTQLGSEPQLISESDPVRCSSPSPEPPLPPAPPPTPPPPFPPGPRLDATLPPGIPKPLNLDVRPTDKAH